MRHFAALLFPAGVPTVIDQDSRTTGMASQEQDDSGRGRRFYLAAWRWHFYAGIFVLPFAFLLAASGLAMLVSEPLDRYFQSGLLEVAPRGNALPPSEQAAAVAAAYPDSDLVTFRAAASPAESTRIDVSPKHAQAEHAAHGEPQTVTVFVEPYTAEVLGELDANRTLYAWAKALHGTLLLGTFGDYVIEIAAGFGVLLIASGVYLWWPRGKPLRQALFPAVAIAGARRWRNLHGAIGAWVAPLLLFFFLSGMAWTPFWGGEFVQTWSSLPGEQFDAPLSDTTHEELNHGAHHEVPWAIEQTQVPASGSKRGTPGIVKTGLITLDDVVGYARTAGVATFRVHWPRGKTGVWTVATTTIAGDTQELDGDRIVHLEAATGNVLGEARFADYSPMGKFMAAGIPLHQGDTGGVNLAVNGLFCLCVLTMIGAAGAAWWARRPSGMRRLVPPPLPRNERTWHVAVDLMLVLSLAFPLVAATIAAVLAIDYLLLSRVPALGALFE
jgi:uncharacterized iron-regulated membrane protein